MPRLQIRDEGGWLGVGPMISLLAPLATPNLEPEQLDL